MRFVNRVLPISLFSRETHIVSLIMNLGKSTLALLLTNDESLRAEKVKGDYRIIQDVISGPSSIGTKTMVSHTTFPEPSMDKDGLVYYDTPGFADSRKRTPHMDIANAMFLKQVAEHAEKLKVLVAVNYFSVRPTSDRNDFQETLTHLKNLFNATTFKEGIGLVVTKVDHPDSDEEVVEYIADFILDVKAQLEETSPPGELAARLTLLDQFLSKDNQTGSFDRIALFRKPGAEGLLNDDQALQRNKHSIQKLVNNLMWVNHTKGDVGYVLSDHARLLTKKVYAQLETKTVAEIRNWFQKMQHMIVQKLNASESLNLLSDRPQLKKDFAQSQLPTAQQMGPLQQIIDYMSKFKPRVDSQGVEVVASYGVAMDFLENVDSQIRKANWTEVQEVGLRTAAAISNHLRNCYTKAFTKVQKATEEMFGLVQIQLTDELTQLVERDNLVQGDVTKLESHLEELKSLVVQPDLDHTDWFSDPAVRSKERLGIEIDLLLFLGSLSSSVVPEDPDKSIAELRKEAINETTTSVLNIIQNRFQRDVRNKLGDNLSRIVNSLKSGFAFTFPTSEVSSMAQLKSFIESQFQCISKHEEAVEKQRLKSTRVTMAHALNLTLADLSCFITHKILNTNEEQKDMMDKTVLLAQSIDLGMILDNDYLKGVDHNDLMLSQVWQPMKNFLNTFVSSLGEVTLSHSENEGEVIVQGNVLSLEEVINKVKVKPYYGSVRKLSLVASHTIFIDTELNGAAMNGSKHSADVSIVSPIWWAAPNHYINLNGKVGEKHPNRERDPGDHGKPGEHGGNGANFFGLGLEFRGAPLRVSANGGDGGPGENGTMGMNGTDGKSVGDVGCRARQSYLARDVAIDGSTYGHYCSHDGDCEDEHYVTFYGGPGKAGHKGGDGGQGGQGGFGGKSIVYHVKSQSAGVVQQEVNSPNDTILSNQTFQDGAPGQHGKGGPGGWGGNNGPKKSFYIDVYSTDGKIAWNIFTFGLAGLSSAGVRCTLKGGTYHSQGRANSGANGMTGGIKHHFLPIRHIYSITSNRRLLDTLRISAIKLSSSKNEDKASLLQPVTLTFINSTDSWSNLPEFSSTPFLYEEYLSLERATSVWSLNLPGTEVITTMFKSLQERISQAQHGSPRNKSQDEIMALTFLEAAVSSKLASLSSEQPLLIVNMLDYMKSMKENALLFQTKQGAVARYAMIGSLKMNYEKELILKITEASLILKNSLEPEVRTVMNDLKRKEKMLEGELEDKEKDLQNKIDSAKQRRDALAERQGFLQAVLSSLKIGLNALGSLPLGTETDPSDSSPASSVGFGEALGIFSGMIDQQHLKEIDDHIQDLNRHLKLVEEHKQKVGKTMPEVFVAMHNDLERFTTALKSRPSSAALDLSKWEIKSFLSNVKGALRSELTLGFVKSDQEVVRCFELMDDLLATIISIHDRVQQYKDQARLAGLMADLQQAAVGNWYASQEPKLQTAIAQTDSLLTTNVFLLGYRNAISSFTLWAFPFAPFFESEFHVASHRVPGNNKSEHVIENVAFDVAQKVDVLQNNVKEYYSTIAPFDHVWHWINFTGTPVNDSPSQPGKDSFYILKDNTIIRRLLGGERLLLTLEVENAPPNMDAVKFRNLRLDFRSKNKTFEAELLKKLNKGFIVNMTHMGDSQFICSGMVSLSISFVNFEADNIPYRRSLSHLSFGYFKHRAQ